jgi:hypothetical protein
VLLLRVGVGQEKWACLLEVGSDGVHLDLVDGDAAVVDERGFVVGQVGCAISVRVVGDLVVH